MLPKDLKEMSSFYTDVSSQTVIKNHHRNRAVDVSLS